MAKMAERVDNLVRKLTECATATRQRNVKLISAIMRTRQGFLRVLPFLNGAEMMKWEKGDAVEMLACKTISLAQMVEDVIDKYNFYMARQQASSSSEKIINFFLFCRRDNDDNLCDQIRRYHSEQLGCRSGKPPGDELLSEPLLPIGKNSKHLGLPDLLISFRECFLGINSTKVMEQFFIEVYDELKELQSKFRVQRVQQVKCSISVHQPEKISENVYGLSSLEGRHDEIDQLEDLLLTEETEPILKTIAVTGVAGIGKTALTTAAYKRVKRRFECHARVTASQNSTLSVLQNLLAGVLKSQYMTAPRNMDAENEASLMKMISHFLDGKKFLLFVDDISSSREWKILEDSLPPQNCRGRILVTSRKMEWNFQKSNPSIIRVESLELKDAKKLLDKHAIMGRETWTKSFQSYWAKKSPEISKICECNPFAIATVGGMLSKMEINKSEWSRITQNMKYVELITLCYSTLPPVLKGCFLYGALFPSHFKISCKRIQRLWIAEGLVQQGNLTPEEAAEIQLHDLIKRNLFHVAKFGKDGKPKYFQLLQPMREFALNRSKQYQACITSFSSSSNLSVERPLRLSIGSDVSFVHSKMSGLHSLLVFEGGKGQRSGFNKSIPLSCSKLLSILDLQGHPLEQLPDSIGNIVLLKYLGLRGTKLFKLPSSLTKLQKLQTLDLRETSIGDLPRGCEKLKRLRHLLLANSFSDRVVGLEADIGYFQDLQTFSGVRFTDRIGKGLQNIPQLKKLSVGQVKSRHSKQLGQAIEKMKFLQSLTIKCELGHQIRINSRNQNPNPIENLQKLRVGGNVENFLDWAGRLSSLTFLYVWDSWMVEDPFKALQSLPNLVLLSLCNAYVGEKIKLGAKGFKKLKSLSVLQCEKLKWMELEKGAMPRLEKLTIAYCPQLSTLPAEGLESLTSLKALRITGVPNSFVEQAKKLRFEDSNFNLIFKDVDTCNSPESTSIRNKEAKNPSSKP